MADTYIDSIDKRNMDKTRMLLCEMPAYITDFLNEKYAYHMKPTSIYAYAIDLRMFLQYFSKRTNTPVMDITVDQLGAIRRKEHIEYIAYMRTSGNSDHAIRRSQASITGLYEYLVHSDEYRIESNIPKSIPRPKAARIEHIDVFSDKDLTAIRESIDDAKDLAPRKRSYYKNHIQRDNMVITLLLTTGMRVSELVGINLSDFKRDYTELDIVRKERTRQTIYLSSEARTAIIAYINGERKTLLQKAKEKLPDMVDDCRSPLLLTVRGHYAGRISTVAVERLVKTHSLNTEAQKKTPHEFRRTFGSQVLEETNNLALTAALLGHSSPDVTLKHYSRASEKKQKEAAGNVKFRNQSSSHQ